MSKEQAKESILNHYYKYFSQFGKTPINSKMSFARTMMSTETLVHTTLQEAKLDDMYGLYIPLTDDDGPQLSEVNEGFHLLDNDDRKDAEKEEEQKSQINIEDHIFEKKKKAGTELVDAAWEYMAFVYAAEKTVKSRTFGDFLLHPFRFISERIELGKLKNKALESIEKPGASMKKIDEKLKFIASVVEPKNVKKNKNKTNEKKNVKKKTKRSEKTIENQPINLLSEDEIKKIQEEDKQFLKTYHKQNEKIQKELNDSESLDYEQLGKDVGAKSDNTKVQSKVNQKAPSAEVQVPKTDN